MTREEIVVCRVLVEHERWVATLRPASPFHRAFRDGLDLDRVRDWTRLHRRTARRALERLTASGIVTRNGDQFRLSRGSAIVTPEQSEPAR